MKLKLMTMVIAIVAFSAIKVNAQQQDESRIKLLNTDNPGVLKLVHAIPSNEPITVNFITDEGVISSDEIRGTFPKGLTKKYDVSKISDKDFRMEISTPQLTVIYHVIPSKDKKSFTTNLEEATHHYDVVMASR